VPEPEKPVERGAAEETTTDESAVPPALTWDAMLARGRQPKAHVKHFYWFWVRNHPRKPISPALRLAVLERDLHHCLCCGATADLVVDHVYPVADRGPTRLDNLQTLCRTCNRVKADRYLDFRPDSVAPSRQHRR
jgi:hypothetical protein